MSSVIVLMAAQPDEDNIQSFVALSKDTMVADYRIADKIGAGGMGYSEEHLVTHRVMNSTRVKIILTNRMTCIYLSLV